MTPGSTRKFDRRSSERQEEAVTHFFDPGQAIGSMRDTGYRDGAAALAEIIDNSVQAQAKRVEVLITEREAKVVSKKSWQADRIAVLDNGTGMTSETLIAALQFGNGAYKEDHSGIGKFGMGLPQSSISQCRRVDVWTWQNGPENAIHTSLDIDTIEGGDSQIPTPEQREIPPTWRDSATGFGNSGTLVVWSKLDRCQWKTGNAILRNTEAPVGRMYRYFLSRNEVEIRFATFDADNVRSPREDYWVVPNDPIYLMEGTSCPPVNGTSAIFDFSHEESFEYRDYSGEVHEVRVTYSVASPEARKRVDGKAAGNLPHGKHARANRGISLVRNGRELHLDTSMLQGDVLRDRWWGCEIQFPAALDELFGVTNSKQAAVHFSRAMELWRMTKDDKETSFLTALEDLKEAEDMQHQLYELVQDVMKNIANLSKLVELQNKGEENNPAKANERSAVARATEVAKDRKKKGSTGLSDADDDLDPEEKKRRLEKQFNEEGLSPEAAAERALTLVDRGYKFDFREAEVGGRMFFDLKRVAGVITITLNSSHPAYRNLFEVLRTEPSEDISKERLLGLFADARDSLEHLFYAWARLEDEESNDDQRAEIENVRYEWGKLLAKFFASED